MISVSNRSHAKNTLPNGNKKILHFINKNVKKNVATIFSNVVSVEIRFSYLAQQTSTLCTNLGYTYALSLKLQEW